MKKNWNCKWPEIYKNPKKHEELVRYEDPKNLIFKNILKTANFKDKTVLDIGAGTGRVTLLFSKIVKKIYALEIEKSQVNYLKRKLKRKRIKNIIPKLGKSEKIPFPKEYFDIIISTHAFGGRDKKKTLKEMLRVLKPKGKMISVDSHYTGEFMDIWDKYSDKGVKKVCQKNCKEILKLYPFKTKIINNGWEFPSVKKAVELLGYVLGGEVGEYLLKNKKKKVKMEDIMFYGVKK